MSRKEARRPGLVQVRRRREDHHCRRGPGPRHQPRQFRRLKAGIGQRGSGGWSIACAAGPRRGRWTVEVRDRVVELIQTTYRDFNDCHGTEKLREVEGLRSAASTVRRLRRGLGLPPKRRRRPPQHRARRPRRGRRRRPRPRRRQRVRLARHRARRVLLLGAIDDATGTVLALHFRPAEDLHGYLTLLRRLAARDGLPVTLYGDRLGVFVRNDAHWSLEEELQGAQHPTHFGQVLRDLGIGYIAAHSPQAKGRIERLWDTLQDRLVAELRLRGIHTVAAAEAFLPAYLADHNRHFAQPARRGRRRAGAGHPAISPIV